MAANAQDSHEIHHLAKAHQQALQKYFPLKANIPSHDTIDRAFEMLDPKYLENFQRHFNKLLNTNQGKKYKKSSP